MFVESLTPERAAAFEEVEPEVKTAWLGARKAAAWEEAYKKMRAKYELLLPGAAGGRPRDAGPKRMSRIRVCLIVFACVYGGALFGFTLRLPEHHRDADSRDVLKAGAALIGTMAALVLGLLVASAKSSYDNQREELIQICADVALLDRALAPYGPTAVATREQLRSTVEASFGRSGSAGLSRPRPPERRSTTASTASRPRPSRSARSRPLRDSSPSGSGGRAG